jgi:hypothetical protein
VKLLDRVPRWLVWGAALALIATPLWLERRPRERTTLGERLLGPIAGLAASIEWVRADHALRHERWELAYARAEHALALAPRSPEGWKFLARHFAFQRASPEREPDASVRRQWIQAAFDVLERGEQRVRPGGELAFERGRILLDCAEIAALPEVAPAERPWPGRASAIYEQAARAFARSEDAGHAHGREYADLARQRAHEQAARGR